MTFSKFSLLLSTAFFLTLQNGWAMDKEDDTGKHTNSYFNCKSDSQCPDINLKKKTCRGGTVKSNITIPLTVDKGILGNIVYWISKLGSGTPKNI